MRSEREARRSWRLLAALSLLALGAALPAQAAQQDVYCQQDADGRPIPQPYGGTRRNIPCGPAFQQRRPSTPPASPAADERWKTNPAEARCQNHVGARTPPPSITNAQQLVDLIFGRYNTGQGIGVVQITNLPFPACLVVIQGTEFASQSTGWMEDVAAATTLNDNFRRWILTAINESCPKNSAVVLAGHSLGGMEAQLVAADPWMQRMGGYWPLSVVTFGSPKVTDEVSTVVRAGGASYVSADYRRFTTIGDPIPFSTRGTLTYQATKQVVVDDRSPADRQRAMQYYNTPLGGAASLGNAVGSHMWYPCVEQLKQFDALGRPVSGGRGNVLRLDPSTWRTYAIPQWWGSQQPQR